MTSSPAAHGSPIPPAPLAPAAGPVVPGLAGLYLRLICVPAIWGGTFIAGRIVSASLPPATAGFIRFVFATLALLVALQMSRGLRVLKQVTRRQLLGTMALGATGIWAYNLLFFSALAVMPAGRTSLIIALNPVVTLLIAAAFLGDRLSATRWAGVGLALLGVWIVVTHGDLSQLAQSVGKGELCMFGAICGWAVYTLLGRKVLQGLSPLVATLLASLWGTLFLGIVALFDLPLLHARAFTPGVWAGLAFLGVLGTAVAFVWYYEGINRLGAARTVVFNNLVPIFGVLLGWLMLGEPLSVSLMAGGVLAIAGVFLVNRVGR
ncbi:MAG: DMT family transporter [Polaromonas sp.]